mmetsp:Transcript_30438/g.94468  ORF Transcript_30438/g.94468 Transcript_30438/m.94468 type:complete len:289 (-) Transcript_30438:286-1152(-)
MRTVWKPPLAFRTFACSAFFSSASSLSFVMHFSVPAQEKPLGKRSLAIEQTALTPSPSVAFLQRSTTTSRSRPTTEIMACFPTSAARCMASPRSFTSRRPSSKVKTPAWQSAVYSPSERPATHCGSSSASPRSARSFAAAARPPTNIAGWQYCVSASLSSGPERQRPRRSYPRISFAFSSITLTSALSSRPWSIPTYCEPCPGKSSAMPETPTSGPVPSWGRTPSGAKEAHSCRARADAPFWPAECFANASLDGLPMPVRLRSARFLLATMMVATCFSVVLMSLQVFL